MRSAKSIKSAESVKQRQESSQKPRKHKRTPPFTRYCRTHSKKDETRHHKFDGACRTKLLKHRPRISTCTVDPAQRSVRRCMTCSTVHVGLFDGACGLVRRCMSNSSTCTVEKGPRGHSGCSGAASSDGPPGRGGPRPARCSREPPCGSK